MWLRLGSVRELQEQYWPYVLNERVVFSGSTENPRQVVRQLYKSKVLGDIPTVNTISALLRKDRPKKRIESTNHLSQTKLRANG